MIKASGNSVESYWPGLFAQALGQADVGDLIENLGAGAPAAAPAGDAAEEKVEEAPKEEKKEEVEDVAIAGVFDDDEDDY